MLFKTPKIGKAEREVIVLIDELRTKLRFAINNNPRRWTGYLRRNAFAAAIKGSNSIEGYNVTVEDALAAVQEQEPLEADRETWRAVSGYRDAMTYVLRLADDPHFEFHQQLLRSLHFMMLQHELDKHPGQWRPGYIGVRDDRSGEIVYEGPNADLVPGLMSELIETLNTESDEPVMIRAAMAHLNLTMIHPFSDGNGRMARALQSLVLVRENILSETFCSIEEYLGKNTDSYYAVLATVGGGKWQPKRSAVEWVRFCLTAHYRQAATLLKRSHEVGRLWELIEQERRELGLPERCELALMDAAHGYKVRNVTYRTAAEVSEYTAGRDLKELVKHRLLIPRGERRGRYYVGAPGLREFRESVRERIKVPDPFAPEFNLSGGKK